MFPEIQDENVLLRQTSSVQALHSLGVQTGFWYLGACSLVCLCIHDANCMKFRAMHLTIKI